MKQSSSYSTSRIQSDSIINGRRGQRVQAEDLVENFLLIWLDNKIDESNDDFRNSITKLRQTVNTIEIFRDPNECINYISTFENEKTFLIISGALCDNAMPRIYPMSQIYSIYIFCRKPSQYDQWAKKDDWPKVKGIFTVIDSICDSVRQSARECDEDSIVISGQIEPSFMYTVLFKEIILEIKFDETKETKDLAEYARENMAEYSKALSSYEQSLEIRKIALPSNHPDLAQSYNNIGSVYRNMGEYSKALSSYQESLEIQKIALPPNHPSLAVTYNNIGLVYNYMDEYSKALSYYEKDLEISKKTLPPNHHELATSYNNIGGIYDKMGEYSKALSSYEQSLAIYKIALPTNHPDLAISYNNIGMVYDNMGEYSKALSSYEQSLEIRKIALPPNHPSLATSYNNIGLVYHHMGEYSKALSSYQQSLEIKKIAHSHTPNHPSLATSYNNIGRVYDSMDDYSKALSYYEKALQIHEKSPSPNHSDIESLKNNIELAKQKL
ncbi:unnamed protein product [Rotaria sordida]|uniref:Kinesin light chain n=1 Tax=Rotaria sordida TaxID=392033 RepID=A0A815FMA8_9BILA|nr:unnamed protein product [Rotaria sordida]CAF1585672.1 unnamed protein product [Rotaria sordida]